MSSQIFKQNISNFILFQLLDDIAVKNVKDSFYFVDHNVYKRGVFTKKIEEFYKITSVPVLINTSFNIRGEPIVCSIEDAYRCFLTTELDYLICGNQILNRDKQFL